MLTYMQKGENMKKLTCIIISFCLVLQFFVGIAPKVQAETNGTLTVVQYLCGKERTENSYDVEDEVVMTATATSSIADAEITGTWEEYNWTTQQYEFYADYGEFEDIGPIKGMGIEKFRLTITDGVSTVYCYFTLLPKDSLDVERSINGKSVCHTQTTVGTNLTLLVEAETSLEENVSYEWYQYAETGDIKLNNTSNLYTVTKGTGNEKYYCVVSDGNVTEQIWFYLMPETVSPIAGLINGVEQYSIYCDEETELTLSVGENRAFLSDELTYQWYHYNGERTVQRDLECTENSLVVKRTENKEIYVCCVSDGSDVISVDFTLYEVGYEEIPDGLQYRGNPDTGCMTITGYTGTDSSLVLPSQIQGMPVTTIAASAFKECTSLTNIVLPKNLTTIGDSAFSGCTGLTSIELPTSVDSIGRYAFSGCSNLQQINIPEGVAEIESRMFLGCTSLQGIHIPASVKEIDVYAFSGCAGLKSITVAEGNTVYDSRNNCNAIVVTSTNTLLRGCEATVVPATVTAIESFAFQGCTGLTAFVIPEQVKKVGYYVFSGCTNLTRLTFPAGLEANEDANAPFDYTCTSLKEIVVYMASYAHSMVPIWLYFDYPNYAGEIKVLGECKEHVYGDWVVTKEATDKEKGEKVRVCIWCGHQEVEEIPAVTVAVEKIKIAGVSKTISAGKKIALTATVTPKNATNTNVKWTSSNKKYATVSSKGVVTTKKAGAGKTVTITAKAKDGSGVVTTYKIRIVKHAVKSIKIKAASKTLKVGKKLSLKTIIKTTGKTANKKVIWTSSNKKYATVNSKGVVTAKKAGKGKKVTITVTTTDGTNKKAKITIRIK